MPRKQRKLHILAQAAAARAFPDDSSRVQADAQSLWKRFTASFQMLSDPESNKKLVALAVGQMLCSVATLMHDTYLPVYVQDELGLSNTKIGAVQGLAQFTCQLSKGVSGVVGDILGSQVRVLLFGMFLTFACKPMFCLLSPVNAMFGAGVCLYWYFFAKLMDRFSRGIREAPTKAIMNELARESGDSPDAAYGFRQSVGTAGVLIGASAASAVFTLSGHNYVMTFAAAIIPTGCALIWLLKNFRKDLIAKATPAAKTVVQKPSLPSTEVAAASTAGVLSADVASPAPVELQLTWFEKVKAILSAFKPVYWQALLVVCVLYFARFDFSFLMLRAKQVMPKTMLPWLSLTCSIIQMLVTIPLAKVAGSSVKNRNRLLVAGFAVMVGANAVFGLPAFGNAWGMLLGACLLGCHMAMTHSVTVSMVASYQPTGVVPGVGKLSGTAVSITDFILGFALAAANGVAGMLSDMTKAQGLGNVGCFMGGATACCAATVLLLLFQTFGDLGREDLIVKRAKKAA